MGSLVCWFLSWSEGRVEYRWMQMESKALRALVCNSGDGSLFVSLEEKLEVVCRHGLMVAAGQASVLSSRLLINS